MPVPTRTSIFPIYSPSRGLVLNAPAPYLDPRASPDCQNVRFYDGIVEKRKGYPSTTYAGGTITGVPIKLHTYTKEDGTDYEILATTTNLYYRTTGDWTSIASGLINTVDSRVIISTMYHNSAFYLCFGSRETGIKKWDGTTYSNLVTPTDTGTIDTITLNDGGTGYTANDVITIVQSDGSGGTVTVNTVDGSGVILTITVLARGSGYSVADGLATTGGTGSGGKINITAVNAFYKPKIILPYQYRLLLFNIEESGTEFPIKFRYCCANDFTDWSSTGSGSRNMIQGAGSQIINAVPIKDYAGVYKDKSISVLDYVGGTSIFATAVHIDGIGLLAQDAIVNLGTSHIFLGSDYNIYEWNGGWELVPIGNAVKKYIKDNLYVTNKARCFAVPNYEKTEAHFFIPIGTDDYPTRYLTYNWTDKTWALNTVASCSGGGNLNTDGVEKSMIALSAGTMHNYDYSSANDGATAIDSYFTTSDVTVSKEEYKIMMKDYRNVYVDAKGDNLSMYYSVDEGSTWSTVDTDALDSTSIYNLHAFNFAKADRNIRFKFANATADESYAVRFVGVEHKDIKHSGRK